MTDLQWQDSARRNYSDAQVATAAARAAIAGLESGSTAASATVSAHKAAVKAGGEYRCRPDRIDLLLEIPIDIAVVLLGSAGLGLLNPDPKVALAAALAAVAAVPFVAAYMVNRNSGFYLNSKVISHRT